MGGGGTKGGASPTPPVGCEDKVGGWAGKLGIVLASWPTEIFEIGGPISPGISILGGRVSSAFRPLGNSASGARFSER
jgi:hypothetical protein